MANKQSTITGEAPKRNQYFGLPGGPAPAVTPVTATGTTAGYSTTTTTSGTNGVPDSILSPTATASTGTSLSSMLLWGGLIAGGWLLWTHIKNRL